ncbi:protein crumbs homolog 1 [Hydra vulgaris]|uniref:protein crumbs homolog 1 n=1 Tax=Hydra vulgaris TaxID=6087 RepID=UPI0006418150|nr:protein crumbs homolog 1 [Hydra vulgaris]XP_047135154.1 protein crumbs homolog 1 [Hydra vulgaris]
MFAKIVCFSCCLITGVNLITFNGVSSYASANFNSNSTKKFNEKMSFVIRTRQSSGFLLGSYNSRDSFFAVGINNGRLCIIAQHQGDPFTQYIGGQVDTGAYMNIVLERTSDKKTNLSIEYTNSTFLTNVTTTNVILDYDFLSSLWLDLISNNLIFIGKSDNLSSYFPNPFKGCLFNIEVSSVRLHLDSNNTEEGCISANTCFKNPCVHGYCVDIFDDFECVCNIFYTKKLCNETLNVNCSFSEAICKNNSTCINLHEGVFAPTKFSDNGKDFFECMCEPGYKGYFCEREINECENGFCQNSEKCSNLILDYECKCLIGWGDKNCTTNLNDCKPNPCENGGTCIDLLNAYVCNCSNGFEGKNCTEDINECAKNICMNNGSCLNNFGSFNCTCHREYFGEKCQYNNTMICEIKNPCKNGVCSDDVYGSNCKCNTGYIGNFCDLDRNKCESLFLCGSDACLDRQNNSKDFEECKKNFFNEHKVDIIIGVSIGVVILIAVITIVLIIRFCKNKSGMEGTYSPNREEQNASHLEMNTLKKPNAERLI